MAETFLPPWLNPPDPVENYQRGIQIGAAMGAQRAQQRMAEQSALRQQQELAMQSARNEAIMGLQAQESRRQEEELALRAQEAARKLQAQMRFKELVANKTPYLQAMMQTPELWGNSLAGVAQMIKEDERQNELKAYTPKIVNLNGHDVVYNEKTGTSHVLPSKVEPELIDIPDAQGNPSGVQAVRTPTGVHLVPQRKTGLNLLDKSSVLSRISSMRKDLRDNYEKGTPEYNEALATIKRLEEDYKASNNPASANNTKNKRLIYDRETGTFK